MRTTLELQRNVNMSVLWRPQDVNVGRPCAWLWPLTHVEYNFHFFHTPEQLAQGCWLQFIFPGGFSSTYFCYTAHPTQITQTNANMQYNVYLHIPVGSTSNYAFGINGQKLVKYMSELKILLLHCFVNIHLLRHLVGQFQMEAATT